MTARGSASVYYRKSRYPPKAGFFPRLDTRQKRLAYMYEYAAEQALFCGNALNPLPM